MKCPVCGKTPVFYSISKDEQLVSLYCCDFGKKFQCNIRDVELLWDKYVNKHLENQLYCEYCNKNHSNLENKNKCITLHQSQPKYKVGDWIRFKTRLGVGIFYYEGMIQNHFIGQEGCLTNNGVLSSPAFVYKIMIDFNNTLYITEDSDIEYKIKKEDVFEKSKETVQEICSLIENNFNTDLKYIIYPNGKVLMCFNRIEKGQKKI